MFRSRKGIYFVHIPKNAGNSVRSLCEKENIKVISHNIRKRNKRLLSFYRKKNKLHAFCISRNPYDRLVSAFHYLSEGGMNKEDYADSETYLTPFFGFDDFVKYGLKKASREQIHFLPQVFWIQNHEGGPEVESVLRLENLQNDVDSFCNKMGFSKWDLNITNRSNRSNWERYYNSETRKIVSEIYNKDFQYFNYPK